MIAFLLLGACVSIPASIPREAGHLNADSAQELLSVASPDLPYMLLTTGRVLAEQDYRACPVITRTDTTVSVSASGCADSAQFTWVGSMTYRAEGTVESLSFSKFGVTGTEGDWNVTGTLTSTRNDHRTAETVVSRLAITSNGSPPKEFWVDTKGTYTQAEGNYLYADTLSGTLGMEQWGLAELTGVRTAVAFVNYCYYGAAGTGSLLVEGDNQADYRFHVDTDYVVAGAKQFRMPGPPPVTTDTGYSPIDSGDSGGTDSGDSGGTDTGGTDTGPTDPGTTGEVDACGCSVTGVDGVVVSECMIPTRVFAYPFVSVGG